jgi:transposase
MVQVTFDRVAFLDVHRDTVATCIRVPGPAGRQSIVKTFRTMTPDLLAMADWLKLHGVTHVGMESTGVLWKPVYYVLEEGFTLLLVNPAHMKNVPGRKTDVKDSQWGAELLECGLLRGSFVPPPEIRDLRDLTRYRTELVQERTRQVQRLHKLLQDAGIKLSSVASNILGVSGRLMVEALQKGSNDPEALAELARGRLRAKIPELKRALQGNFRQHHAFLSEKMLQHIDELEQHIEGLERQIEEVLRPFEKQVELVATAPGVSWRAASVIAAEIGLRMEQFPSAEHISSWAGVCPGNNESAGKHRNTKTRKGDRWLRTILVEAGLCAIRVKNSALRAQYYRLRGRCGHPKAVMAVAHSLLVSIYHMLKRGEPYKDLGGDYYDRTAKEHVQKSCVRRLERLGYRVTLQEQPVAQ